MLRTLFFVIGLLCFSGQLFASPPPPVNDSAWSATNIGTLPLPPVCPAGGHGNSVVINGTTQGASYNTFDYSAVHCSPGGSPDVWYRFVSTSASVFIGASGFNGLDTFYIKLFKSDGSCFSLIPMGCETSIAGFITASFQTPDIGEEYYLVIGGNAWYKTGDFTITIKSEKICNECVNESDISLSPAPWFGRYGTADTVTMCYTAERWDYLGSADIHGIVPRFGQDWDMATLVPLVMPQSYSANNAWHWMTGVNTPDGLSAGFFFDPDNDGDPSNNAGDSAGILDSWTGCWKIATLPYCNTYDLSVSVNAYSDNQTGVGSAIFACDPSPPMFLSLGGWCCPSPTTTVINPMNCNGTGTVTITGVGNAGDMFNISIYDTGYAVVGYYANVPFAALALPPGDYNIEAYNINSTCIAYTTLTVEPYIHIEISQTAIGCGSGTASLLAKPFGGLQPYTYNFVNHNTSQQNDSVAFQVNDGWQLVTVTDAAGCSVTDSIWVVSEPLPDAAFSFAQDAYCVSRDTVSIGSMPASGGGTFLLSSPNSVGITVNPNTGLVDISNSTLSPPYWVYVKYNVGTICQNTALDSFQVVPAPAAPTIVGNAALDYCIGSASPVLTVIPASGSFATWYDSQFNLVYVGSSYTTPLNGSTTAGSYIFGAVGVSTSDLTCVSSVNLFSITAIYPPYFNISSDTTICPGETATLAVSPCSTCVYSWVPLPTAGPSNAATTNTAPASSTTYTLTATNAAGCASSLYTTVNVDESGSCGLTIYSGITPNGDGHNDYWQIDGIEDYPNAVVSIYNRWGKLVWIKSGYDNLPGGTVFEGKDLGGTDLPDGTYYYLITGDGLNVQNWLEISH